jgi:predicted nucleic acid-binding protein
MVVADTSPLNYLILIGVDGALPQLFGQITAPKAVIAELQHPDAPPVVLQWIANPPEWIRIATVPDSSDVALSELGAGEREAIILSQIYLEQVHFEKNEGSEVLLLMDEIRGRSEAARRGIVTMGTLGVLDAAAEAGLIDLPTSISQLRDTNFHATPSLFKRLLDRHAARQNPK